MTLHERLQNAKSEEDIKDAYIKALGLKKLNHSVVKEVNPQIQGMINAVAHLVTVENI